MQINSQVEEMPRATQGARMWSFCTYSGCPTLWGPQYVQNKKTIWTLPFWVLWRTHYVDMIDDIISYWWWTLPWASFCSLEVRGWDWNLQLSNQMVDSLATSSILRLVQQPAKGQLFRTKDVSIIQEIPGDLGAVCQGAGVKDQMLEQKILIASLSMRILGGLCQEMGQTPSIY